MASGPGVEEAARNSGCSGARHRAGALLCSWRTEMRWVLLMKSWNASLTAVGTVKVYAPLAVTWSAPDQRTSVVEAVCGGIRPTVGGSV